MACDAGAARAATQKYFAQNHQRARAGAGSLCPKMWTILNLAETGSGLFIARFLWNQSFDEPLKFFNLLRCRRITR